MRVEIHVPAPLRRWHVDLVERLRQAPATSVTIVGPVPDPDPAENMVPDWVLRYERLLHKAGGRLTQRVPADAVTHREATDGHSTDADDARSADVRTGGAEVILDLTSRAALHPDHWRLEFDGRMGLTAAVDALRRGRTPQVRIVDGASRPVAVGRPGSETPGVLAVALDDLLAGTIVLIDGAVRAARFDLPAPADGQRQTADHQNGHGADGRTIPESVAWSAFAAKEITRAAEHRAYRMLYRAPHWRVGWRWTDGPGLLSADSDPEAGWHVLPDDGFRFYADPFPFVHEGVHHLFVEDFDHRLGKGVISVTAFDESGPLHAPQPVLEHQVHLSYPFVLSDGGEVWMIPETTGAGTVELYRAERFPDRWTRERILLQGLEASDTTVFTHRGRWWMLATVRHGGSYSDALHVWHADRLVGPWTPHPDNPVLLDISSARPAGRVVEREGRLIRPVQDGRGGYGAALAVVEITQLDENRFQQRLLKRIAPGPWWPGRRLHTLNRAGRLECIDGSAMAPRLRLRQRSRRAVA